MALNGAVFCRLLLISTLVGCGSRFTFGAEDVCQGKKTDHFVQFLGSDEVKKVSLVLSST